jgi:hypothetical protein
LINAIFANIVVVYFMLEKKQFYINGEWIFPAKSNDFIVINPSNFETEEEAIAITNDSPYGLGNFLQTENKEKVRRVAKQLRVGVVQINGNTPSSGTPFGGYSQSGNGREGGVWGLHEYLEVKAISGWK